MMDSVLSLATPVPGISTLQIHVPLSVIGQWKSLLSWNKNRRPGSLLILTSDWSTFSCCCISQSLDRVQAIRSNFHPRSQAFGSLCPPQSDLWFRAPATGVTENKQLIGRGPLDREVKLRHLSWKQTQLRLLQALFWCIYVPDLCLLVLAWLGFCLTSPPNLPTMRVTNALCSNEGSARRTHLNQEHKHDGWLKLLMNWKCLLPQNLSQEAHYTKTA